MFESIGRSWQLFKYSWAFLRRNKSFIAFPLISSVAMLLACVVLLVPARILAGVFATNSRGELNDTSVQIIIYGFLFVYYVVVYTIGVFFNVGLAGAILKELDGEEASVGDGLRIARSRFGLIVQYAVFSATVGLILQFIREKAGWLGGLIGSLGGMAWNLATFFVVPLLVVENKSMLDVVKDSASLLRRTFGEQVVGGFGIGAVITLMGLALMAAFLALAMLFSGSWQALIVLGLAALMAFVLLGLVSAALSSVYRVMVFRYAQTGVVPDDMDVALLQGAFKEKKKKR
ncbi:DUF6159 family protein [Aggregatilineales bacterium SYSU G02658]